MDALRKQLDVLLGANRNGDSQEVIWKYYVRDVCRLYLAGLYPLDQLTDNPCIEVVLRCFALDGDGFGSHDLNDSGILASVMASGFKGELAQFQAGVTMEISCLDAWYSSGDGSLEGPATYVVRGLCRKSCILEFIL